MDNCRLCGAGMGDAAASDLDVCANCGWMIAQRYADRILARDREQRARDLDAQASEIRRRRAEREEHMTRVGWTDQLEQPSSVVYYVQIGDHIKIGYSKRLRNRLQALRVPVTQLLAVELGDSEREAERHQQFDHARINRRWENFRRTDDLLAHIDRLREANGIPSWLTLRRGSSGPVTVRRQA